MATGRINAKKMAEITRPATKVRRMSIVNVWLPCSVLPSPKFLDTSALPPAPTIRPRAEMMATAGQMMFIAAKAVLPA